jgi:serine/threonine-protein kinase
MVSHRNIVRVFDLVEDVDGTLVLVMELLRGESLSQHLRTRGRLDTKEALAIVVPILSGLGHAHAEGIVHRDVTPANVFLAVDPDGQVVPKLIDFGIAKLPAAASQTLDGRVLGTPRYMAPEHIRGQSIDGRADLFSLAVVLYEALTGTCPFDAPTASASLAAVLEVEVDPDPHIEPKVWLEIARALGKRPYERHPTAAAFADALRLATGETDASLATLLHRAPPGPSEAEVEPASTLPGPSTIEGQSVEAPAPRRPAWIALAIGTTAAAVGAALAFLVMAPSHPAPAAAAPTVSPTVSPTDHAPVTADPPPIERPSASPSLAPSAPTANAARASSTVPTVVGPPRIVPRRARPKAVGTTPGF